MSVATTSFLGPSTDVTIVTWPSPPLTNQSPSSTNSLGGLALMRHDLFHNVTVAYGPSSKFLGNLMSLTKSLPPVKLVSSRTPSRSRPLLLLLVMVRNPLVTFTSETSMESLLNGLYRSSSLSRRGV